MSDFLFQLGVNQADADAAVQDFIKRTNAGLSSIQKVNSAPECNRRPTDSPACRSAATLSRRR